MDYNLPPRDKFTVSRGYKYSFIHIPIKGQKQTLFLLHGWPSHIDDWIYQIRYFESKGYGLIVPDLLGYGDSSNPADPSAYRLKLISQDLSELLDHLQVEKVVGVGHDWGATVLSRFLVYHPDRLSGVAFLGIGPPSPGTPFDLDMVNAMTKKAIGMEMCGYIDYITRDAAARHMMERNAESVMDVLFAADATTWNEHLHPLGGLKDFVENDRRQEVAGWYSHGLQKKHLGVFGREGGHRGPSNYYMMMTQNISTPDEEEYRTFKISQPTIVVLPKQPMSVSEMQKQMLSVWAPNLKVIAVDAGHWVHMERADETNEAIENLIQHL